MQSSFILIAGSVVWLAMLAGALFTRRLGRGSSVGLIALYLTLMGVIHLPGALVHALPWFWQRDVALVAAGFAQSLLGVLSFGLGALAVEPLIARIRARGAARQARPPIAATRLLPAGPGFEGGTMVAQRARQPDLAASFVALGLLSALVLLPLSFGVPTGRSIAANLSQLLYIGLALGYWRAWQARRHMARLLWLLAICALPLFTVLTDGFLGFGAFAMIGILIFIFSFSRIRMRWLVLGPIVCVLVLSLYVTYMRDREQIRAVVWGGEEFSQRTEQIAVTLGSMELFDPQNQAHLNAINDRLNQNALIGVAIAALDAGYTEFARGETLVDALTATVPRVLWPEKPYTAGGSALVTRFTGVEFGVGTSVGVGQVLELYGNFGTLGVGLGFLALGWLVSFFDRCAAQALLVGDQLRFAFWYLPGLGLMIPGNSLAEMASNLAAAFLTAVLVTQLLVPMLRGAALAEQRA